MADYPTALTTLANLYVTDERVESTLSIAINSIVTSITVVDGSRFPTSKGGVNFVSSDGLTFELATFTSRAGNVISGLTRGVASTAASFGTGTRVFLSSLGARHTAQNDEIIAVETELGLLPKGSDATVVARLNRMQTEINAADSDTLQEVTDNGATTTNDIELANATFIKGRNVAGTADIPIGSVDSGNTVRLGDSIGGVGNSIVKIDRDGITGITLAANNVNIDQDLFLIKVARAANGTAAAPAYAFLSGPEIGMYRTAGGALGFTGSGGVSTLEMNSSGLDLASGKVMKVSSTQVVSARKTGWTAATGTADRTTFVTGSVSLSELAERVKALIDDLISHGLIGT